MAARRNLPGMKKFMHNRYILEIWCHYSPENVMRHSLYPIYRDLKTKLGFGKMCGTGYRDGDHCKAACG